MSSDVRLVEDYLPIAAISKEASREKSVRKGHISTLHLWWARRPLVACRAAVYGALMPADRFRPQNGPEEKRESLTRANAAKFVERLCKYPKDSDSPAKAALQKTVAEAQQHILKAHAERLTQEITDGQRTGSMPAWVEEFDFSGERVTYEDVVGGRAPRPRVLDMFAGGGAIPLEALRLGCEAYALDLNPVAHIIELCTLVYPQKYGKPDPSARGVTGPPGPDGKPTWGGLAEEVRYWGNSVLEKVKAEIGNFYPPIPDPKAPKVRKRLKDPQLELAGDGFETRRRQELATETPTGYLTPVAYLWTRTVRCKNASCGATVPLVRQTWLCKKAKRYVALRLHAPKKAKRVTFQVVESDTASGLGFDPEGFSSGGNATCPFCGTVADIDYVKNEGWEGRMGTQLMAIGCVRTSGGEKVYVSGDDFPTASPEPHMLDSAIEAIASRTGITRPDEPIAGLPANSKANTLGITVRPYGMRTWGDIFTSRQCLCLMTFASAVRAAGDEMASVGIADGSRGAVVTCLGALIDRLAVYSSTQCVWHYLKGERTAKTFGRQVMTMTWDFAEASPFNVESASWPIAMSWLCAGLDEMRVGEACTVRRGSATSLPWNDSTFDAVVTDPPYYDNVPYADLSDFFYVWLKRSIAGVHPEHFAGSGAPKKAEAVADPARHGSSKAQARKAYESMMGKAFCEANRVLKDNGNMSVVYAHKTTLGWATLVDALRDAGFVVTEAWPLDTEMKSRLRGRESSALATSIFLVARKRSGDAGTGNYEDDVQPELDRIVRERVETLWEMGITGSDLVIAAVGAGLRAFTRFRCVEYANGEEVPAESFLTEVESVVLDSLMAKIAGAAGGKMSVVDPASRFYVLWRYVYKAADVPSGEAIVFTYGQHVELDGQNGLSNGRTALLEKKKGKYRLRDYTERGEIDRLGLRDEDDATKPVPLIDVLHRTLWLVEHQPRRLREYLDDAMPNREQLRLLANALAGPGLSGKSEADRERLLATTPEEQSALGKLLGNWRVLVPEGLFRK